MADTKRSIESDINSVNSIQDFIVVNEEIAANSMRRIRDAVIGRRDFLSEIAGLYNDVRQSYRNEVKKILRRKKKPKDFDSLSFLEKKDQTACVLLTTNRVFYGGIVRNTYNLFKKSISEKKVEIVIVGKTGKRIFEEDNPNMKYTYFEIPDTIVDKDIALLKPIVLHIINYEKVIVFHSKFETLVRQTPNAFLISENLPSESARYNQMKYIFEPSLDKIIEYFEKEIFSTIFENTIHESDLSKFASRMITLDTASDNIKENLRTLYIKQRYLRHQRANKDQVNSLAGIMMKTRRR